MLHVWPLSCSPMTHQPPWSFLEIAAKTTNDMREKDLSKIDDLCHQLPYWRDDFVPYWHLFSARDTSRLKIFSLLLLSLSTFFSVMGYKIKHKIDDQNHFATWKDKNCLLVFPLWDLWVATLLSKRYFFLTHLSIFRLFQVLLPSTHTFFAGKAETAQEEQHTTVSIKVKALEKWYV